jgi:TRAP-type mannitol/chloroaromatic compound transport system permease small subunit
VGLIRSLDRAVAAIVALGRWLVIPVVLLLFLQWPLRDLVRAYSRQANDLGQWLFALVVAVAVTAATRARTHLAADAFAMRYGPAARQRIDEAGALLVLIPWALFLLVAGWPIVSSSVRALEAFPDTGNPGYFIVKGAMALLALLVLAQALLTLARPRPER